MSVLIEHYAGAFPTWLAPVQAVVIPIADRHLDYAYEVKKTLLATSLPGAQSLRIEIDEARESMQKKIRNAQMQKIPYMLVIGDKEAENGTVAVRRRSGGDLGTLPVSELAERLKTEVLTRSDLA
ncbi:His/Gly/Thr/Pro-type tRNA ligase C-terminal domain-containing protein [Dictyobacter kobayashii]|nr:His/Gly/Thr/Pro-type tRNA ligase C-terminal domain-containing protein [Dictyobacter kobayashii]